MRAVHLLPVVVVSVVLCDGAAAQSIEYVAQGRYVRAFHDELISSGETEQRLSATDEVVAPGFGDFDAVARAQAVPEFSEAYGEVSQRSALRGDGITASGNIFGQTRTLWGGYDWESVVGATFDVVGGPMRYELGYAIERMEYGEGLRFNDFSLIALSPAPLTVFDFGVPHAVPNEDDTTRGVVSGVLSPGRYAFAYRDESSGKDIGESLDYEWALRLTPVPEPGSVAGIIVLSAPLLLRRSRGAR